jgi:hypothetical protein
MSSTERRLWVTECPCREKAEVKQGLALSN